MCKIFPLILAVKVSGKSKTVEFYYVQKLLNPCLFTMLLDYKSNVRSFYCHLLSQRLCCWGWILAYSVVLSVAYRVSCLQWASLGAYMTKLLAVKCSEKFIVADVMCVAVGSIELDCQSQQHAAGAVTQTQTVDVSDTSPIYLSSYITQQTKCGSFDNPWRLVAAAGRRLRLYLLDFASHDTSGSRHDTATATCQVTRCHCHCHVVSVLAQCVAGLQLTNYHITDLLSPVSIQTQSLALRALRKRKPQETQALTLASSQSWLPLLRPSIPIGWRLRLLRARNKRKRQPIKLVKHTYTV